MGAKYSTEKEEAKAEVEKATAMSLTGDMWTSINSDRYLAVTCHFMDESTTAMPIVLLGVNYFPQAQNISADLTPLMEEWGIKDLHV